MVRASELELGGQGREFDSHDLETFSEFSGIRILLPPNHLLRINITAYLSCNGG